MDKLQIHVTCHFFDLKHQMKQRQTQEEHANIIMKSLWGRIWLFCCVNKHLCLLWPQQRQRDTSLRFGGSSITVNCVWNGVAGVMSHVHWSTTSLKPLTCEENNTGHFITVQCSAGRLWVLAHMWMPLWHEPHTQTLLQTKHTPHENDTPDSSDPH